MTEPTPGRETRAVSFRGREVVVRRPLDAQLVLMAHASREMQNDALSGDEKIGTAAQVYKIILSFLAPEDRSFVTNLIVEGEVDFPEIMTLFNVFSEETEKPKARRGRPAKRTA